ncbi:MAG: hypothetical protein ACPHCI_07185, partial [Solirubrobacterales bacterium]
MSGVNTAESAAGNANLQVLLQRPFSGTQSPAERSGSPIRRIRVSAPVRTLIAGVFQLDDDALNRFFRGSTASRRSKPPTQELSGRFDGGFARD